MRFIGKLGTTCIYDSTHTEECPDFDFHAGSSGGYGEFAFVYGPSAGGLVESVQFRIRTSGEQILEIYANPYFKTRRFKLSGKVEDVTLEVERVNAMFSRPTPCLSSSAWRNPWTSALTTKPSWEE